MKSLVYAMMLVTASALTGCGDGAGSSNDGGGGSSGGSGGTGGAANGGGGSGGAASGGGTGGATTSGKDCTQEADFAACRDCFEENYYPQGAPLYNALGFCIFCNACYTTCDGAGSACPSPPAEKDACDGDVTDMQACSGNMMGCIGCAIAEGATCHEPYAACSASQECTDFAKALNDCPQF